MNQSRIKKIRHAARIAVLAVPNLSQEQRIDIYNGTIKTMKSARKKRNILQNIPKNSTGLYPKQHKDEPLDDFKRRRFVCNAKRRLREKERRYGTM